VIRFNCTCGKRLKVDAAYAGRSVKCAACGAKIMAPSAIETAEVVEGPPADAPPVDGLDALAQALREAPPRPTRSDVPALRTLGGKPQAANGTKVRPGAAGRPGQPARNGQPGDPMARGKSPQQNQNKAVFIGIGAAVGLILIVVIIMIVASSGPAQPVKQDKPVVTTPPPPVDTKPKYSGRFAGDFFGSVPDEKDRKEEK
jgi:hypothetical protein